MPLWSAHQNRSKNLSPLWEGLGLLKIIGLCLTLFVALLSIFPPVLLQQAELRLYDIMASNRATPPQSPVPVLVGIDEESLRAYGQWPWPRYRLALLIDRLHELGIDVVALDFLMPELDRTSLDVIMSERQRDGENAVSKVITVAGDSNSKRLAATLGKGTNILGYFFEFNGSGTSSSSQQSAPTVPSGMILTNQAGTNDAWPNPTGMIRSIPLLTNAVSAEGFTNAIHDIDGALRRVPLLLNHNGSYYPSFALAAMLLASHERNLRLFKSEGETFLVWGDKQIPLDQQGNLLLDFRSEKHSFNYLSARSILNGDQPAESLKGKIALVGTCAKGLGDLHLVPSGKSQYGFTIHANIIDNILTGTFIRRPGWARGAELFAVLLLGVASTWLLSRPGFIFSLITILIGSGGCFLGGRELLVTKGLYISPLLPMLTPVLIMTFLSLVKYGIEARKVRQRTLDLLDAQDTIIISLSALAATRDKETGRHIQRTQNYVKILARELSKTAQYSDLDESSIELLTKSAPLHDIGKVGIPDCILQKPAELSDKEYEVMKSHPLIGVEAIAKAIGATGHPEQNSFLHYAQQMIESHHERWDGKGYPHGLQGEEIPLAGRLMALADVYDALVSQRVYKKGFSHDMAMKIITDEAGITFDPAVVKAFISRNEDFMRIAREFADDTE